MNSHSQAQDGDRDSETVRQIRERAYLLWEMEGRPEGRSEEYWHRARELLEGENESAYPPAPSRGHRT